MIHRNRHEQRRRNELLLHLTRVVCFHDKRLKVARRRQRHVQLSRLKQVQAADLHFAHSAREVNRQLRNQLCSLRRRVYVVRLHLLLRVQQTTYHRIAHSTLPNMLVSNM